MSDVDRAAAIPECMLASRPASDPEREPRARRWLLRRRGRRVQRAPRAISEMHSSVGICCFGGGFGTFPTAQDDKRRREERQRATMRTGAPIAASCAPTGEKARRRTRNRPRRCKSRRPAMAADYRLATRNAPKLDDAELKQLLKTMLRHPRLRDADQRAVPQRAWSRARRTPTSARRRSPPAPATRCCAATSSSATIAATATASPRAPTSRA